METVTLFEWLVGAIFVGVNAYRRYNTPATNRESTTFQNFSIYFLFYLMSVLTIYVFCGALFDSSPETIGALYGLFTGQLNATLPDEFAKLSAPMVSALFLTTLLPSLPWLSRYDKALLNAFWDRGHIPYHVQKMAAAMRRAPFNFSPRQSKQLRKQCLAMGVEYDNLKLVSAGDLDYRWARINALIDSIEEWQQDDSGRLRRFMEEHSEELGILLETRDDLNAEYISVRSESVESNLTEKIIKIIDKSIVDLFRSATVLAAKACCVAELSESGRSSRITQLGFEGGTKGFDRLLPSQVAAALMAILFTFLLVSLAQELGKPVEFRRFGSVGFMTFLMFFTYGSALTIALDLKRRVGMGYNELTRQRSWLGYVAVGCVTALSWFLVTASFRYIVQMLSGVDTATNLDRVLTNLSWSFPYALQSVALAVSISWILDYHQSRGLRGRLNFMQRLIDVSIAMAALALTSVVAFYWMEGLGWFEGHGTKEPQFQGKTHIGWFVAKSVAVAAVVGWLVPMWFYINRSKAPDQIAGRLIVMNKKGLSREIRNLAPNQLVEAVAAVGASMAVIDDDVSRSEEDVYQIICGHLAGLANSDVDIDAAGKEFSHCLSLLEQNKLDLEARLKDLKHLPLLSSLMPFVASSIAFADGVYMDQERELVDRIKKLVHTSELT
ncbi:hypothetical protein MIB92_16380 [Aestuariirhabdus sp. Z084]|uniref:hypothetical protein n=1 Tax=Aestuariirhabdus haliotis TaxID=2918751 RepID=UPI00201B3DAF|nr:hypothetical protein [Aestuariirhabdus haliotis]MCL6417239.1 hypothetical protein [Aestuariirhabdus haliotis]MCL6421196.1 hypothetical protein [Aestuariirhabdus haliotis]